MPERLTGLNDPRGTLVAGVNGAGDAFVGIVLGGWTGRSGDDLWDVYDAHGDTETFVAGDLVVIDGDRVDELGAALEIPDRSGTYLTDEELAAVMLAVREQRERLKEGRPDYPLKEAVDTWDGQLAAAEQKLRAMHGLPTGPTA